uniref:E3 ubiquitin/ISG15 ligase TRIM25-like n=1 Tax=Erpetoichthys calabaricus TaxID=27687 RepID=A0A8C4SWE5_ERPCA
MAEAQFFVSQDEFTCSVCLEILSDPVTIPCGHSFCLKCLTDCWDQSQECSCPQCRETFMPRPELRRSTVLNEVIKKLKKTAISPRPLPQPQNYASPGDVECDFCTVNKFRAVKSCLTCMASYCQTHLQLHFEIAAWKDHKLVDPDGNLKEKLCVKHLKSLEIFCKTDETCVCLMCVVTGHKNHEIVELEMEREEKEKQLEVTLSDITRRLEEREKTLEETRRVMEQMRVSGIKTIHIKERRNKLKLEEIRKQEKREMKKAEGVLEQLGKEIQELKRRDAELQKLSDTKDHIRFLQVRATLHRKSDQTGVKKLLFFSEVSTTVELDILFTVDGTHLTLVSPAPDWLLLIVCVVLHPQSHYINFLPVIFFFLLLDFYPLTMDINTAHRELRLSEGNKKVTRDGTEIEYPYHPDRSDYWEQVLCREALTGTHCYWEVEFTGDLMRIGFFLPCAVFLLGLARHWMDRIIKHVLRRYFNIP